MRSREARRRSRRGRSQGQAYKCSFWCLLLLHNSTFWSTLLHARERRVTQKLKTDGASRSLLRQVWLFRVETVPKWVLRPCQNGSQDGCQNGSQKGFQMGPKLAPKVDDGKRPFGRWTLHSEGRRKREGGLEETRARNRRLNGGWRMTGSAFAVDVACRMEW